MNSVLAQDEVLSLILSFAIPRPPPVSKEFLASDQEVFQLRRMTESMSWVARLRAVSRRWRDVIDDPMSNLWFLTAQALQLDPPLQLYSGGTHQQVCRLLLVDQFQKVNDHATQRRPHFRTGCVMIAPRRHEKHPNPDRPPVKLPDELASKICETAKALESFLRSINFSVLTTAENSESWHRSSLIRYQMFLHLKRMHPTTWLIPTADIEFCWLAHIFRTKVYWDDMSKLGIDPNHSFCLSKGESASFLEAVKGTAALWEATYSPSFPYLPAEFSFESWSAQHSNRYRRRNGLPEQQYRFFPVMSFSNQVSTPKNNVQLPVISLTPEEVQGDLEWFPQLQQGLDEINRNRYDVLGGPGSIDQLYLTHIIPSYERFLNLCYQQRLQDAAPPYVLDLVWHAHQADPVAYKCDCRTLFNREFWHHPWPNGLGVSADLSSDFRCAWKGMYGSTIENDWQLRLTDSLFW